MNAQISSLSPAQVNILDIMSFIKTPKALDELNNVLADYYAKRLDEEMDTLWANGTMTDERVEEFRKLHERTPY